MESTKKALIYTSMRSLIFMRVFFSIIFILSFPCLSANEGNNVQKEFLAKSILTTLALGSNYKYDVTNVIQIVDSDTLETHHLCYLYGGPPNLSSGAVGIFDMTGKLIEAKPVKNLYGFESHASVLRLNDSAVFRIINASGTGLHDDSLLVLSLKKGKILETLRCSGEKYSMHGEFYEHSTKLVFSDIYGDKAFEIIRLVNSKYYSSQIKQDAGNPATEKNLSEVYEFDNNELFYVRKFE